MSPSGNWNPVEGTVESILRKYARPFEELRTGQVPSVILPEIFPAADCAGLVQRFFERGLLHPPDSNETGLSGRVDIGTSLGVHSKQPERFFEHAIGTHRLFETLFNGYRDPVQTIYNALSGLLPEKRVMTAREPDGRRYGPAIFRSYHDGQGHNPHYDSVAKRSRLFEYAVSRFDHQFAAVMCIQNSQEAEDSGQAVLYKAGFSEEVGKHLAGGTFHRFANDRKIEGIRVELQPGDLYFFYSGNIHEVPAVVGETPRVVLAAFIALSDDDDEVFVWS